jgi:hypothetical protein
MKAVNTDCLHIPEQICLHYMQKYRSISTASVLDLVVAQTLAFPFRHDG